jgi:phosphoglycolate phosphatase
MLLPISDSAKFWLWVALFGMAKLLQYTALLVLGMEGWRRLKRFFGKDKDTKE